MILPNLNIFIKKTLVSTNRIFFPIFIFAEALILSALHHPGIIKHVESFEDDGFLCIVAEFCERGDLTNFIEARKAALVPESQVLDWFVQLCLAMLYLHKKKVLHRDLKTQNVFISADNMVS